MNGVLLLWVGKAQESEEPNQAYQKRGNGARWRPWRDRDVTWDRDLSVGRSDSYQVAPSTRCQVCTAAAQLSAFKTKGKQEKSRFTKEKNSRHCGVMSGECGQKQGRNDDKEGRRA
ncbi:hypothetical protein CEXT_806861 [Caerostris extrusa]|uniref:Uncharacterized protein n=1 Tax=Caerostris extrusa TaxID=172846 RepID=A0AAV4P4M3_CAEEX|nr:hypothetical protein CEXT_806861 [Caerostris extrusa]